MGGSDRPPGVQRSSGRWPHRGRRLDHHTCSAWVEDFLAIFSPLNHPRVGEMGKFLLSHDTHTFSLGTSGQAAEVFGKSGVLPDKNAGNSGFSKNIWKLLVEILGAQEEWSEWSHVYQLGRFLHPPSVDWFKAPFPGNLAFVPRKDGCVPRKKGFTRTSGGNDSPSWEREKKQLIKSVNQVGWVARNSVIVCVFWRGLYMFTILNLAFVDYASPVYTVYIIII